MVCFKLEPSVSGLSSFYDLEVVHLLVDQKLCLLALFFSRFFISLFFFPFSSKKSLLIGDFDIDIMRVGKSLRRHKVIVFY